MPTRKTHRTINLHRVELSDDHQHAYPVRPCSFMNRAVANMRSAWKVLLSLTTNLGMSQPVHIRIDL